MAATRHRLAVSSDRNNLKRFPSGSYVDIEHHLLRLALVSEMNPRVNNEQLEFEKQLTATRPSTSGGDAASKDKVEKEYWARGTGYGHHNRPEWDLGAYLAAQKEKDKQMEQVLHKILSEIRAVSAGSPLTTATGCGERMDELYHMIECSALVPFMEQYLKADSFLEIGRHASVYRLLIDILRCMVMNPALLPLLCPLVGQSSSLFQLLQMLHSKAELMLQHIGRVGNGSVPKVSGRGRAAAESGEESAAPGSSKRSENEQRQAEVEDKVSRELVQLYTEAREALSRAGLLPTADDVGSASASMSDAAGGAECVPSFEGEKLEAVYKRVMQPLQFDSSDISLSGQHAHHYSSEYKRKPNPVHSQVVRIAQELTSLSTSLPLDLCSAVFVRTDDEKLNLMKALITGPEGTPYSGGCFAFDVFFPPDYPKIPPLVNLQTTGQGSVRFNPNLYNNGKVCLSLLGTWEGQQGERWNEVTSTFLQVLVSIQSLILVPEPYFNEPGYEAEIGTEAGRKHSQDYSADIRVNTIKHAMIGQLQRPPEGFEEVVKKHFYLKRDRILEQVDGWLRTGRSKRLETCVQQLRTELHKLQPPDNLSPSAEPKRHTPSTEKSTASNDEPAA